MLKNLNLKHSFKIVSCLLFAFCLLAIVPSALGQETQGGSRVITISPPSVQRSLNPGNVVSGYVKIINDSSIPLTFTTSVLDYVVLNNDSIPSLLTEANVSNKYAAATWISASPSTFTVNPQQKQDIFYTLSIPYTTKPGGHYAALVFTPTQTVGVAGTGAQVKTQIGTLFYISVAGPINQNAVVTRFNAPFFSEYGPVTIQTQIKNFGDLHIRPTGEITVTDIFGRIVGRQAIAEQNIFPEVARNYENAFGAKFMIGPYKATLAALYGTASNLPLVGSYTFWVFPWKIALVVLLAIVALILLIIYLNKKGNTPKHTDTNTGNNTETPPEATITKSKTFLPPIHKS